MYIERNSGIVHMQFKITSFSYPFSYDILNYMRMIINEQNCKRVVVLC